MASSKRASAAPRERAQGSSAPAMKSYWLQSYLGVGAILLAATLIALALGGVRDRADARSHLVASAGILAQAAGAELSRIRARLEAVRTDQRIGDALESADPERLADVRKALGAGLPSTAAVHVFAPQDLSALGELPSMSYAGMDLARQASQERRVTALEVHKVGQPDRHLAIAAPVLNAQENRVLGVVYLSLPLGALPASGPVAGKVGGILHYRQVIRDDAAVVDATGAAPERAPDHTEPVPGSRLQVAAWLTQNRFADPAAAGTAAGLYTLSMLLIGVVLWLGHRKLHRAVLLDLDGLRVMVDDAVHRRPARKVQSPLADTQGARDDIAAILRRLKPGRPSLRGADPASAAEIKRTEELLGPSSFLNEPSVEVQEIDAPEGFDPYAARAGRGLVSEQAKNPLEVFEISLPDEPAPAATAAPAPVDAAPAAPAAMAERLRKTSVATSVVVEDMPAVAPEIFRAYDIRGRVEDQLTPEVMHAIGRAIGSEAAARGDDRVYLGRDLRPTSELLAAALADGVRAAGPDVVDLGTVPTPLLYFACCHGEPHAGAMVTGSHNPPEYNGVKPVLAGASVDGETIQVLRRRIERGILTAGAGNLRSDSVTKAYRARIVEDVTLARPLKVVLDCGNAVAATVAPDLFRALGCEVVEHACDPVAGESPGCDPAEPARIRELAAMVREETADLGLGFDGDGDRLAVVDSYGRFVPADRVLMLMASDVLSRHPGTDVIFDVKCTRHLQDEVRRAGGRPILWRSGHAPLKAKLRESEAMLAGELSGHIMFKERWLGFDDAVYAGARLLEVLSLDPRTSHEILEALPGGTATPELSLPLAEGEAARIMKRVMQLAERMDGVDVIAIDGLRAEFERGWGLVRASNTEPKLSFRFEGDSEKDLKKIQSLFRKVMDKAAPGLALPF